ncbi:terminase gpA endonuclease subunit [Thalassospira sp. TSL5-1]|uniref:phage terminase large subunit family protein n=1 Tax=Thalassospira sp. TSL5-1 TaxID=1544451 RepID=UPI00093E858E
MMTNKGETTLALITGALALGIAPDPVIKPSAWAIENLIVGDGPHAGSKWSSDLTPYAAPILDCLAAESPHTRVSVRKSAQVGLTVVGVAWIGSIVDKTPGTIMVIFPTISLAKDFNSEKLTPAIEQTPVLNRKVNQHRSRSAKASTARKKRFPGGSMLLTGANSPSELRSKTIKYLFCDEVDQWPLSLDGQGDPMKMANARQIAFHATGDYKKFETSTPTIKGISRIDNAFEEGDQRFWMCPCPHCGEKQRLVFGSEEIDYGLKFNDTWPYNAHYICKHCGGEIEHYQKKEMLAAGEFIATFPEPGRHPSFHIDALSSNITTWDNIAEEFLAVKDDPNELKTFVNLWLGEAWEERGDAPEWDRLYVRRETYGGRTIPPGGIILTGAADVQADGIYYEVKTWGRDKQSWSIDIGFLEGDTADPANPVWGKLDQVYDRRYPDAYGNTWQVDAFGVDSGFNSNTVYQWCRARPKAMALKGEDGWHKAAISSTPTKVDISIRGKRLRRGVELWHIGTWGLKAEMYANLRKDGMRDGAEFDPPGFMHYTEALHDERFFKQLTAEHIKSREVKGRTVKEWVATGPNHYHDCSIYNAALAVHKGVGVMTDNDWAKWEAVRCRAPLSQQGDLLAGMNGAPAAMLEDLASPDETTAPKAKPNQKRRPKRRGGGFVGGWS